MENATQNEKVIYTGSTITIGGRGGSAKSTDGKLNVKLTAPGAIGEGTNPEQLFAAGWSACFIGAMGKAAAAKDIKFPADATVHAEVDLVLSETDGYSLKARLNISLPGIDNETAKSVAEAAHSLCPYSKMVKGNIKVETIIL
ncbi:peroxiredoxin, Ohr subfamily [Chryseobacterium wanjuense]|uniref:Peroxiredoxin, Ohr subfamily n=1 Tax=Chryseobacterium wanjuense TaxID=356305 RepID=A0A1I0PML0_9FLAO|nr:Ohr family peroxiredoxin [Chryseobacterium wanjuense]SEW15657.1 peroxiredoxin, Ohr subfamily [Chryseobacterium wanjuense]